jgi:hypothetical protein
MSDRFCCDGDCNQGRDCPARVRRESPWVDRAVIVICLIVVGITLLVV